MTLRVGVGRDDSRVMAGEGVAVAKVETVNSVGGGEVWVEAAAGSAVTGSAATSVGLGWVAFHWMAKMIKPMMPMAITTVHKFDFKVAPRFN